MLSKKNRKQYDLKHANGRQHFSLRKTTLGLASVLLSTTLYLGSNTALTHAAETNGQSSTESSTSSSATSSQATSTASSSTSSQESSSSSTSNQTLVSPAKTQVADANNLTDSEKAAVISAIKAVNSDVKSVIVDNDGTAHVTLSDGQTVKTLNSSETIEVVSSSSTSQNATSSANNESSNSSTTNESANELTSENVAQEDRASNDSVPATNPSATDQTNIDLNTVDTSIWDWYTTNDKSGIVITKYKGNSATVVVPNAYDFKVAGKLNSATKVYIAWDAVRQIANNANTTSIVFSRNTDGSNLGRVYMVTSQYNQISDSGRSQLIYDTSNGYWVGAFSPFEYQRVNNGTGIVLNIDDSKTNTHLTSIDASTLRTDGVTRMMGMFAGLTKLKTLVVGQWDTSKVTDMMAMFYNDQSLTNLDVSDWNTSNVTTMAGMFEKNYALKYLDVANWNTSKVTDMRNLFRATLSLSNLDVSKWNVSNVTNMAGMFWNAPGIYSKVETGRSGSNVANNLLYTTKNNFSNWNVGKVTDMTAMFSLDDDVAFVRQNTSGRQVMTYIDLSSWKLASKVNTTYMFSYSQSGSSLNDYLGLVVKTPAGSSLLALGYEGMGRQNTLRYTVVKDSQTYGDHSAFTKTVVYTPNVPYVNASGTLAEFITEMLRYETKYDNATVNNELDPQEGETSTNLIKAGLTKDASYTSDEDYIAQMLMADKEVITNVDFSKLQAAVEEQPSIQATDTYQKATSTLKENYDNAVAAGKTVLANDLSYQKDVDAATKAIIAAKNALLGIEVNKTNLQQAIDDQSATQQTYQYYNGSADKKTAYDNAVTAGKSVLADEDATQDDVDAATKAITAAKAALDGQPVNKTALQKAVDTYPSLTKTAYDSSNADTKAAFDTALSNAKTVLANPTATQDDVDNAKGALDNAALAMPTGALITNKDAGSAEGVYGSKQTNMSDNDYYVVSIPVTIVTADGKPMTIPSTDSTSFAIRGTTKLGSGTVVAGKTLAGVTIPSTGLKFNFFVYTAKGTKDQAYALTNDNITVQNDSTGTGGFLTVTSYSTQYGNTKYVTITVYKRPNAVSTDIQKDTNISDAAAFAKKYVSNYDEVSSSVTKWSWSGSAPSTGTVGEQQGYLVATVNGSANSWTTGTSDISVPVTLNVITISKDALQKAVDAQPTTQGTAAYYNADSTKQNAYDEAITAGKAVLADPNATQQQVDDATKAIETAKGNLDGKDTDKQGLQTSISNANTAKSNGVYDQSSSDKKAALDAALEKAEAVNNSQNATQSEVDQAKTALDQAIANLDGLNNAKTKANAAIDNMQNLNDAQKTAAKNAVSVAQTVADVTTAQNNAQSTDDNMKSLHDDTNLNLNTTADPYLNADSDLKTAYDNAKKAAEAILVKSTGESVGASEDPSHVATIKQNLDNAAKALNGTTKLSDAKTQAATDLSGLTNLNNAQMQTAEDAVSNAKTVADVTAAVSAAKNTNANMGTLAADENYTGADQIKASVNFTNADDDKQKAYTDALDKVKTLLDKQNGSSTKDVTTDATAVQEAQTELDNAAKALNGQSKFDADKQKALADFDTNYPNLNNAQKATAKKRINDATSPAELTTAQSTNSDLNDKMGQLKTVAGTVSDTKATDNYNYADPALKSAYDATAGKVSATVDPSGDDLNSDQVIALINQEATNKAALNGEARKAAKEALQTAHDNGESGKTTDSKYYNATEAPKSAYDQALTGAETTLSNDNATLADYQAAKKAIDDAYGKLDGQATNKEGLEAAIAKVNTAKGDGTYDNSSVTAKSALDAALEVAKNADNDTNASQATVDDATKKLTDALAGLDNTQAKDIQAPEALVPVPAANKDSVIQSDKDAIVANVKAVNPNADTVEVADDGSVVVTFKDGSKASLDKSKTVGDVDKSELTTENTTAKAALETPNFKNADSDKQAALTTAIAEADAILTGSKKDIATQADVKTATDNLKNALSELNGDSNLSSAKDTINGLTNLNNNQKQTALTAVDNASSASDITNVVNAAKATDDQMAALKVDSNLTTADDIKKTTNYLEADSDKKTAFDNALAAAQTVTNQETGESTGNVNTDANHVSEIKKALDDAANALNGEARKAAKEALQTAHDNGESGKTTDSKYYNATDTPKANYDKALTDAESTLSNDNATLADYQAAKKAIDDAYGKLDGQATNKQELQGRVSDADNVRQSDDYKNASDKARQDYETAITAGQGVLDNDNATQAEVNTARDNIDKAKQALTTSANSAQSKVNSNVTPTPVGDKTNLTSEEQASIKKAVEDANKDNDVKSVTVDPNSGAATVEFNDGSKATIPASKTTTDTNKTRLKNDLDDSKTDATKAIHDKASTATKEAYDAAVSAGQTVFDNDKASQKAIDEAADAIETAKKAMEDSANAAQSKVNTNIDKTAVGNKDALTSDEQAAVKAAVEKGNSGTTVSVDDKGTATVTFNDGSKATIAPEYTLKGTDKSSLVKELNNEDAVKNTQTVTLPDSEDKTPIQIYQRASDEARKAYDDAITNGKAVNADETATQKAIDDATKAIQDAVKGLVSSSTDARLNFDFSFDKTPVVDPSNVSEAEKQAILDKIAAKNDNIDKSKSTVNADGSATIVLTDGSSVTLTSNQTIKDVNKDELRQDIATADKLKADTTNYKKASDEARSNFEAALSDAKEKEAGKFSQADVDTSDANLKKAISALQTSINSASANNPATKTPVGRGRDVNEDESSTIKAAVSDANPGNKGVVVNSDGSATVTLANGGQVTIPASATTQDTNKTALKTALDNGNAAIKGSDFTNASTTAQEELKKAVQDGQDVFDNAGSSQKEIDDAASAISTALDKVTKSINDAKGKVITDITKTPVGDKTNLTDDEKKQVAENVKQAVETKTPSENVTVNVNNDGSATVTFNDGSKATVSGTDTVKDTDKTKLKAALDEAPTVESGSDFTNASTETQTNYKQAVEAGQKVFDNPTSTQKSIDEATEAINNAKQALADSVKSAAEKLDVNVDKTQVGNKQALNQTEKDRVQVAVTTAVKTKTPDAEFSVSVDDQGNATVTFNDGSKGVITADKTVTDVDKSGLQSDVSEKPTLEKPPAYYNASEEAKSAYDDAITAGQEVLDNSTATKDEVDKARANIAKAKEGLTGQATNKEELQSTINEANVFAPSDTYTNSSIAAKVAFEEALTKANEVNKQADATQAEVDKANEDLVNAIDNLTKTQASAIINPELTPVPVAHQGNLTATEKSAIKTNVEAKNQNVAGVVVANDGTTTVTFNDGSKAILEKNKTVTDVNKEALQEEKNLAEAAKDTYNYYNASSDKKTAFDQALENANDILTGDKKDVASQADVDAAKAVLEAARTALDGKKTDKTDLQAAIDIAIPLTSSDTYNNASSAAKAALDTALQNANVVNSNSSATQAEVDEATRALNEAVENLANSQAKDVKAPALTPVPVAHQSNLTDTEKVAIKQAIVNANTNVQSVDVDATGKAVVTFNDGSKAEIPANKTVTDVNKAALQEEKTLSEAAKDTYSYYNASSDKKAAFEQALANANDILTGEKKDTASQADVDTATRTLQTAREALDGQATNKEELQKSIAIADNIIKTDVYSNASTDQRKAVDEALAEA
ncbi:BspA family leucine-rich repeat surface protein, partial [Lactobacillus mulieris]|uniref:BspA family leucine-rich repeat surface protein n=1 Tax=Lactobacillus mulieris TaxID=2508708 RepID=UPI0022CD65F6